MRPSRLALASLALAATAACGGERATAPAADRSLNASESAALAAYIDGTATAAVGQTPARALGADASAVPAPFQFSVKDLSLDCPSGGTIQVTASISGQIDVATGSMTVETSGTQTPRACAFPADKTTLTITGTPSVTHTAKLTIVNGQPSGVQTATAKGGLDWSAADGRKGSCSLDYTSTADFTAKRVTVKGTVCGSTIDYTGPLTGKR
jgi:hypothetical protein